MVKRDEQMCMMLFPQYNMCEIFSQRGEIENLKAEKDAMQRHYIMVGIYNEQMKRKKALEQYVYDAN